MRHSIVGLLLLFLLSTATTVLAASAVPSGAGKHIQLVTDYPAVTVKAGETVNLNLSLRSTNRAPEVLKLSVQQLPTDWKATLIGNGRPISAAMPGPDQPVDFSLRLGIPQDVEPGSKNIVVKADGANGDAALPLHFTIGDVLPAKIALKPKLPSLRDSVDSTFEYDFTVQNESSQDLTIRLAASAPANFDTSFTEQYGSQQLSAVPVEAGKSKDLKLKVNLPPGTQAGSYQVKVRAAAADANADMTLGLDATGKPTLRLASANERLNADAVAGEQTQINLAVHNDGSAPAKDVEVSATPPSGWKIAFAPKQIEVLPPGARRDVVATLTPSEKTIAGDYMTTIRATASDTAASSADFRITVTTSTLWGIFGLAIIAIALLVLGGAVVRFGRR